MKNIKNKRHNTQKTKQVTNMPNAEKTTLFKAKPICLCTNSFLTKLTDKHSAQLLCWICDFCAFLLLSHQLI